MRKNICLMHTKEVGKNWAINDVVVTNILG